MTEKQEEYKSDMRSGGWGPIESVVEHDDTVEYIGAAIPLEPPLTPWDKALLETVRQLRILMKLKLGEWYKFEIMFRLGPDGCVCAKQAQAYKTNKEG